MVDKKQIIQIIFPSLLAIPGITNWSQQSEKQKHNITEFGKYISISEQLDHITIDFYIKIIDSINIIDLAYQIQIISKYVLDSAMLFVKPFRFNIIVKDVKKIK